MKSIEIDDDLYAFIAAQTKHIGESASDILRRLLMPETPAPDSEAKEAKPASKKPVAEVVPVAEEVPEEMAQAPRPVTAAGNSDILEKLDDESLAQFSKRVEQFLYVLSVIYAMNPEAFTAVEQIKGKNRIYFATSKEALLENGSSTNPKLIPDSTYWVVTNNNTAKKVAMLEQVLLVLNYDKDVIQQIVMRFAPEIA